MKVIFLKMSVRKVLGVAKLDENLKEEAIRYLSKPVMIALHQTDPQEIRELRALHRHYQQSLFKVDAEPLLMFMGIAQWEWEKSKSIKISDFKRNYEEVNSSRSLSSWLWRA